MACDDVAQDELPMHREQAKPAAHAPSRCYFRYRHQMVNKEFSLQKLSA